MTESENKSAPDLEKVVWLDMEMTGLDPERDRILEIAVILTNKELETIAQGPQVVIHCPLESLSAMDGWNRKHHRKSGLWDEAIASTITLAEAEERSVAFIRKYSSRKLILAGNSIWQDRRFIIRHMPALNRCLHYRMIDVSSIKQLYAMWYPNHDPYEKKGHCHRALADIEESIAELCFYRQYLFNSK